jgi:hypothetical protein
MSEIASDEQMDALCERLQASGSEGSVDSFLQSLNELGDRGRDADVGAMELAMVGSLDGPEHPPIASSSTSVASRAPLQPIEKDALSRKQQPNGGVEPPSKRSRCAAATNEDLDDAAEPPMATAPEVERGLELLASGLDALRCIRVEAIRQTSQRVQHELAAQLRLHVTEAARIAQLIDGMHSDE